MPLTIKPVTPAVGAEVAGVDLARADRLRVRRHRAGVASPLRTAVPWPEDHRRRSAGLQPPSRRARSAAQPGARPPDAGGLSRHLRRLQRARREGRADRALGAGEAVWHTDMSYLELPPDASMLYALEIPPQGGNTWVCGMEAAWAALPAHLKARVQAAASSTTAPTTAAAICAKA